MARSVVVLGVFVLLAGCASSREFVVVGDTLEIHSATEFYIVVPEMTEKVTYNLLGNPFDYGKRAPGRKMIESKPDVPMEIAKYLGELGHSVELGPESDVRDGAMYVISYKELWGWDLRPIIKLLEIEVCEIEAGPCTSIEFEELTFFNSQPTAKSVVPKMLSKLFDAGYAETSP